MEVLLRFGRREGRVMGSEMTSPRISRQERRTNERLAKSLVETCMRNSARLEDLHSGIFPSSMSGNYDDVKVVSPYGEIPWNEVGRISDDEMKLLMIEVVDRVFTYLCYLDELSMLTPTARDKWKRPRLDRHLMEIVHRERKGSGMKNRCKRNTL